MSDDETTAQPSKVDVNMENNKEEVQADVLLQSNRDKTSDVREVRERRMTPKGLEWQNNQLRADFRINVSKWRKYASTMEVLLSDSQDTVVIRKNRDILMNIVTNLDEITNRLRLNSGDEDDKKHTSSVLEQLELIERDHHSLMKDIANHLRDLEYDSVSRT